MSNSAHPYHGTKNGRGQRLKSKLGRTISVKRLERLLKPQPRREVRTIDTEKPEKPDDETPPDKPAE